MIWSLKKQQSIKSIALICKNVNKTKGTGVIYGRNVIHCSAGLAGVPFDVRTAHIVDWSRPTLRRKVPRQQLQPSLQVETLISTRAR